MRLAPAIAALCAVAALPCPRLVAAGDPGKATQGTRVATLAFVGDVLLHDTLLIQAYDRRSSGGYRSLWRRVEAALSAADLTYANLEGPVAEGMRCDGQIDPDPPPPSYSNATCSTSNWGGVYTQFPLHNYPPRLVDDLKASGVDIVSTGNNHALDRGPRGVDATLDALDSRRMLHFGTRRSRDVGPAQALTRIGCEGASLSIAWVACSYSDNGLPDPHDQLTRCHDGRGAPSKDLLSQVHALAERRSVGAVVVTPHWGHEYHEAPSAQQRALARALVAAGADLVVGSHPHVLQPLELTQVGNRRAYVMYSLGNFVADQVGAEARSTVVLYFDVVRAGSGAVSVTKPRYLPLHMADGRTSSSSLHTLVPLDPAAELTEAEAKSLTVVLGVLPDDLRITLEAAVAGDRGRPPARGRSTPNPRGANGQDANLCT